MNVYYTSHIHITCSALTDWGLRILYFDFFECMYVRVHASTCPRTHLASIHIAIILAVNKITAVIAVHSQ
jgi:hypothetical protein